jgi:hypothetical protein
MSNSIYEQFGSMPGGNIVTEFRKFRESMQGKDPHAEINRLLQSGKISQQQLNQAQQMAQQMRGLFGGK